MGIEINQARARGWDHLSLNFYFETKFNDMFECVWECIPIFGPSPNELMTAAIGGGNCMGGADIDNAAINFGIRSQNNRLSNTVGIFCSKLKLVDGGSPSGTYHAKHWRCWSCTGIFPYYPDTQSYQISGVIKAQLGNRSFNVDISALNNASINTLLFSQKNQSSSSEHQSQCCGRQDRGEPQEPPIGRRFLILFTLSFACLLCAWNGWQNLYNNRRFKSAAWFVGGAFCWSFGVFLFFSIRWQVTWGWII